MSEHADDELIGKLANSGIKIYNMYFTVDESTEGRRRLWAGMRKWLENPEVNDVNPYVSPSARRGSTANSTPAAMLPRSAGITSILRPITFTPF